MHKYLHFYITTIHVISLIYTGTLILSGIVLYSYYWCLYVIHLTIKLFYPMKSDILFKSDHRRKIFIAEVLIAFLVGISPAILIAIAGPNYRSTTYPPIFCGIYGIYLFYASMIPNLITGFISHGLVILIVHKLHIVSMMIYMSIYVCMDICTNAYHKWSIIYVTNCCTYVKFHLTDYSFYC